MDNTEDGNKTHGEAAQQLREQFERLGQLVIPSHERLQKLRRGKKLLVHTSSHILEQWLVSTSERDLYNRSFHMGYSEVTITPLKRSKKHEDSVGQRDEAVELEMYAYITYDNGPDGKPLAPSTVEYYKLAPQLTPLAIAYKLVPLRNDEVELWEQCFQLGAAEYYEELEAKLLRRYPDTKTLGTVAVIPASEAGETITPEDAESVTKTTGEGSLSEAEQIELKYVRDYYKSKYKTQPAYCGNEPVRKAEKGEIGQPGENGESFIYIKQRTFSEWQKKYKDMGLKVKRDRC